MFKRVLFDALLAFALLAAFLGRRHLHDHFLLRLLLLLFSLGAMPHSEVQHLLILGLLV